MSNGMIEIFLYQGEDVRDFIRNNLMFINNTGIFFIR